MNDNTMLNKVKLALRISATAYDNEITSLISAAKLDLSIAGITDDALTTLDELATRAVITYVRLHFGTPDDYDRLKLSYDEQKAQLQTATGYTDWGDTDAES